MKALPRSRRNASRSSRGADADHRRGDTLDHHVDAGFVCCHRTFDCGGQIGDVFHWCLPQAPPTRQTGADVTSGIEFATIACAVWAIVLNLQVYRRSSGSSPSCPYNRRQTVVLTAFCVSTRHMESGTFRREHGEYGGTAPTTSRRRTGRGMGNDEPIEPATPLIILRSLRRMA